MKIIIAGSRSLEPKRAKLVLATKTHRTFREQTVMVNPYTAYFPFLDRVANDYFDITEVVSGKARGGDAIGEAWAIAHSIPIQPFEPNWSLYGKSAGIRRNAQMGDYAEGAIVLHDGLSKGSLHMKEYMQKLGKPVVVALCVDGICIEHTFIQSKEESQWVS